MIADELRRQADNFIELDGLKDVIGRPAREDDDGEVDYTATIQPDWVELDAFA